MSFNIPSPGRGVFVVLFGLLGLAFTAALVATQASGLDEHRAESWNMELVGHSDLQGRPAYKGEIHEQGGRYIAYIGHHPPTEILNPLTGRMEMSGTSIVDVTDPRDPVFLHHLPAPVFASGQQLCAGDDLPRGEPGRHFLLRRTTTEDDVQHELWDVTDPSNPEFMSVVQDNLVSFHKAWWECSTGIAYLPAQPQGWDGRGMSLFDLSDPENPRFIRHFGLPGSQPGEDPAGRRMTELHEVVYRDGRVYMAYGTSSDGIFQILDNEKLLQGDPGDPFDAVNPSDAQLLHPQIGRLDSPSFWGVHTAYPLLGVELPDYDPWNASRRDFVVSVSESVANECSQPMHDIVTFVDITDPHHPYPVSNFQVSESPGSFCERGGRFGAHATQWKYTEAYDNRIIWVSYFNAGVRGVDVRNPYRPIEIAYYIPGVTSNTVPINGKIAVSTNNVEVDSRGYVFTFDKNGTGMHILEPTGEARAIANLP